MIKALSAAFVLLGCGVAVADESWTSDVGDIVYSAEVDGAAVFSYPGADGQAIHLYFPGLAGNYTTRGSHLGYYIAPGNGNCPAPLTGPDGLSSTNWGQLMIIFLQPGFPTGFTLVSGSCFGPFTNTLVATPRTAAAAPTPAPEPEPAPEPAPAPEPPTDTPPAPPPLPPAQ